VRCEIVGVAEAGVAGMIVGRAILAFKDPWGEKEPLLPDKNSQRRLLRSALGLRPKVFSESGRSEQVRRRADAGRAGRMSLLQDLMPAHFSKVVQHRRTGSISHIRSYRNCSIQPDFAALP
jgi:hypothetical protein